MYDNAEGQKVDLRALLRAQPEGTHVYVCGPEGLMNGVIDTAYDLGWPADRVHFERSPLATRERSIGSLQ